MHLVNAYKAQSGLTITTDEQTAGKGQRGKIWADEKGKSLLMSIIVQPFVSLDQQFLFSAATAVAVANALQAAFSNISVKIKWPNDIIVNDKKAGGILIENVLRGSQWLYAICGIGLNVAQQAFPENLPNATSLTIASGQTVPVDELVFLIRNSVLHLHATINEQGKALQHYNDFLFKKNELQTFSNRNGEQWKATIRGVLANGQLEVVDPNGQVFTYTHGEQIWVY